MSNRLAALQQFDATKTGVRGLVESGTTTLPPIFRHPTPRPLYSPTTTTTTINIPTVDLSLPSAAADTATAARTCGFFQATNHGIPIPLIDRALAAVRSFHELPPALRSQFYTRDRTNAVSYYSNIDLYSTEAASWRDTLRIGTGPGLERLPPEILEAMVEWEATVAGLGRRIMGFLSEGLGVEAGRFERLSIGWERVMVCHYHPPCPEPEWTVGSAEHKDPVTLTMLVQDSERGLQVKWTGGEGGEGDWVDVKLAPGAIVVNVGDFLQILSNDEYKSVEHRVLANSHHEPRISIATFLNPSKRGDSDIYGPLPELVSAKNHAHYKISQCLRLQRASSIKV